jgi:hypothetical protein
MMEAGLLHACAALTIQAPLHGADNQGFGYVLGAARVTSLPYSHTVVHRCQPANVHVLMHREAWWL